MLGRLVKDMTIATLLQIVCTRTLTLSVVTFTAPASGFNLNSVALSPGAHELCILLSP